MKPSYLKTVLKSDDDRRIASILFNITFALLFAYLIVIISGLYWGDWVLIKFTLLAIALTVVPLGLLVRGHVRLGAIITVGNVLCTVTILAMIGQGLHDIAILSYPVIIVIASLLMPRREFFLSSLLVIVAMGWLVFGESYGFFVSKTYQTPNGVDFLVVATILLVTVLAVDMLAQNTRENIRQANQEIDQRKVMEKILRDQSIHDALTGIYNRSFFEEELLRLEDSKEFPVGIVVADVDDLKVVNDTRGHTVGDELLRATTTILHTVFRASDVLARLGGDEFAVLLPHTNSLMVAQILARIQLRLIEYNARHPDLTVELSLGAATSEQGNLTETFILADQRMYAEKALRKSKLLNPTQSSE